MDLPASLEDKQPFFCFFPIRSDFCFYFSVLLMVANSLLLIYAWLRYQKIKRVSLKLNVKLTFMIIFIESVVFIVEFIINDVYYLTDLKLHPNDYDIQTVQSYSVIDDLFFTFGGFIVQWLFLLVTYSLAKNTLDFYSKLGEIYDNQIMALHSFFKQYMKIRWVRLIPVCILLFWWLLSNRMIILTAYICLILNVIDACLSATLMTLIYKKVLHPYLIDEKKIKEMQGHANLSRYERRVFQREYRGLLFTAYFRFFSIIVFFIDSTFNLDSECPEDKLINYVVFLIGQPFLKILPIFFMIQLQLPTAKINTEERISQVQPYQQLLNSSK